MKKVTCEVCLKITIQWNLTLPVTPSHPMYTYITTQPPRDVRQISKYDAISYLEMLSVKKT